MMEQTSASAAADAEEDPCPADTLPDGEYAIVEILGHRTMIGRIAEVERFGTTLCAIEPVFGGTLLPAVMVGGGSIYQLTPCSRDVALARAPKQRWQLPPSVAATVPPAALPAAAEDEAEPFFVPVFVSNGDDGNG